MPSEDRSSPHRRLDRCLLYFVPEPPTPVVRSFMYRNPVDPGLQAGIGIEVLDPAKNLDEYFLGGVGRVRRVVQNPIYQAVYRLVVMRDEPFESIFRSGLQFGHDRGFRGADSHRTCEVTHYCCSRQRRTSMINRFGARNNFPLPTTALTQLLPPLRHSPWDLPRVHSGGQSDRRAYSNRPRRRRKGSRLS